MYRKLGTVLFILGLIVGGVYLYKNWPKEAEAPRFIDRLPDAEIIGKVNVLDFAKEFMPTLYYYQISVREFASPEFILGQGKAYGLDFQKPIYLFGSEHNETLKEWGALMTVVDSSKVLEGIRNISNITDIRDTTVLGMRVFISSTLDIAFSYGKDWLLLASTAEFPAYLNHVVNAEYKDVSPRWDSFLANKTYGDKSLVLQVMSDRIKEHGIESIVLAATTDSTSITFHSTVTQFDSVSFGLKPVGQSFDHKEFTKNSINAHFDIERLRNNVDDPVYKLLKKAGSKISFPVNEFLNAWDGDIAFRQGGIQTIMEQYIESELDDNFIVTEVTKYKEVKISGFSLYLSMNKNKSQLLTSLFNKGILTKEGEKVRLLYYPPMLMRSTSNSLLFYTSSHRPKVVADSLHQGMWTFDYTPISFAFDSVRGKSVYGKINVPLRKIIKDYLPEQ